MAISEVHVPAIGSECDRVLTEEEGRTLSKLLRAGDDDILGTDHLLSRFASYMACEVLRGESDSFEQAAFLGASYALVMRRNAMLEQWPEDSTPPGFIYGFVERWLNDIEADEVRRQTTMAGLSIREYLRSEV